MRIDVYSGCFFFSSRRRHTIWPRDWSSDVCSSDLHCGQSEAATDPPNAIANAVASFSVRRMVHLSRGFYARPNVTRLLRVSVGAIVLSTRVRTARARPRRRLAAGCTCRSTAWRHRRRAPASRRAGHPRLEAWRADRPRAAELRAARRAGPRPDGPRGRPFDARPELVEGRAHGGHM